MILHARLQQRAGWQMNQATFPEAKAVGAGFGLRTDDCAKTRPGVWTWGARFGKVFKYGRIQHTYAQRARKHTFAFVAHAQMHRALRRRQRRPAFLILNHPCVCVRVCVCVTVNQPRAEVFWACGCLATKHSKICFFCMPQNRHCNVHMEKNMPGPAQRPCRTSPFHAVTRLLLLRSRRSVPLCVHSWEPETCRRDHRCYCL